MVKEKIFKSKNKKAKHCHGGLGGTCDSDTVKSQSVIQNIGNAEGAPNVNPSE